MKVEEVNKNTKLTEDEQTAKEFSDAINEE